MQLVNAVKTVGSVLLVVASYSLHAQGGDVGTASQSSTTQTAKSAKSIDRALAKKVRSTLALTKGISVINIIVRGRGGTVTLEGSVPEQSQIDQATQVAQSVPGVQSVKNALTIRPLGQ